MGVIFPREDNLRKALPGLGLSHLADAELDDMCHEKKVADFILKEVNAVGKEAGFAPMEQLQCVVLIPEELPLTAAQKVQRKEVETKYKKQISAVYP